MWKPHREEGATITLNQWGVEHQYGATGSDAEEYVLYHYVGGEEYCIYHFYDTIDEARIAQHYLNTTCPPQGFTHYYYPEG